MWTTQFTKNIKTLNNRLRELKNSKENYRKNKQIIHNLIPGVQQVCTQYNLDIDIHDIITFTLLKYIKDDVRIALTDIIIPIGNIDSYCTRLKVYRGKLLQEHGVDNISLSIPPDAMGNREKWGEEMSCSEIMLFSNGDGYYDHPECCGDAIYRFYESGDAYTDESSMMQFIKWLYEHNYVE